MSRPPHQAASPRSLSVSAVLLLALMTWSDWQPFDRTTWALEVFPIFIVLPLLAATYRRFPLTTLLYALIFDQS